MVAAVLSCVSRLFGRVADEILRKCVHCGFCTATCPTYQILGDENDGPRGRIYLMKAVMEGEPATRETLLHLDRCLTCRSCETTCPSGVRYGHLVDVGRKLVEERVSRPWRERLTRLALRETLTRRWLFDPAMRLARRVRPLLPPPIQAKVPRSRPAGSWPTRGHRERVLLLDSCTQGAMMPAIDRATARVLDRFGAQALVAPGSGCCGALRHHLADERGALNAARRNIDAWWPWLEQGVEAILVNASGCGVMVKDYGHLLRNDARYAERAARVAELACDPIEWLERKLAGGASAAGSAGAGVGYRRSTSLPRRPTLPTRRPTWPTLHWRPCASPSIRRARSSTARRSRVGSKPCCAGSARSCATFPTLICAAVRPAPTRCCSPSCRGNCATASSKRCTVRIRH